MALNLRTAPSCPSVGRSFCWKRSVAPPGRHWKLRWQFQWDGANKARVTLDRSWDYIFHSGSQASRFRAVSSCRTGSRKHVKKYLVEQHVTSWKKKRTQKKQKIEMMVTNCTLSGKVSPEVKTFPGPCFSLCRKCSSEILYCNSAAQSDTFEWRPWSRPEPHLSVTKSVLAFSGKTLKDEASLQKHLCLLM